MSGPIKYEKLGGSSKKGFGLLDQTRGRLWLAEDHLAYVQAKPYSESCHRFYLNDIQAIVVTRTRAGKVMNAVLVSMILLLVLAGAALVAILDADPLPVYLLLVAPAVVLLALLFGNLAMGPTAVTWLHTAVNAVRLVPLSRLRTAEKGASRIAAAVGQVQGGIGPETLAGRPGEVVWASANLHYAMETSRPAGPEQAEIKHEGGSFHAALFYLTFIMGVSACLDIFFQNGIKNAVDSILVLPLFGASIGALIKQIRSDLPPFIKTMAWLIPAIILLAVMIMAVLGAAAMMNSISKMNDPGEFNDIFRSAPFVFFFAAESLVFCSLGLIGILRLREFRARYAEQLRAYNASMVPEAPPPLAPDEPDQVLRPPGPDAWNNGPGEPAGGGAENG